jgi:FixJ family two-component response regulator
MLENAGNVVAIVDDDPSVREATANLLKANGFKAEGFASASEFLNSSQLDAIGCLILDLRLPVMSGLELQRHLAAEQTTISVVFITAHGNPEIQKEAIKAGAVDFLAKPFSEEALLRATRNALEKSENNLKAKLAEHFLAGLRNHDWNSLRPLVTADVTWSLPGHSVISGEARGVEAVVRRAQTIVSFGINFEVKHILVGQHGVALSLHNTAQRDGLMLDEHLATVFGLRDRKIAAINTYLSDVDMVNAFFISV